MNKKNSVVLVLALALTLRLISINQSFWLDEAINVIAVRELSLSKLVFQYSLGDFHPPLYHIVLWGWLKFFPATEVWARIPSVLLGVATVFFTFKIALNLVSQRSREAAAIAGILLATSGLHIYYSQEARMYALAAFLTSLAFFFLIKLKDNASVSNKLSFVIALVLLLLSDYQPWLLLPFFLALAPRLTTVAFLLTSPWWPSLAKQLGIGLATAQAFPGWEAVVGKLSLKALLLVPVKFLVGRVSIDNNLLYATALLIPSLAAGLAILKFFVTRERLEVIKFIKGWLVAPLFLGILVAIKIPIFAYFRFLFLLPAFYLGLAVGIYKFSPSVRKTLIFVLVITNLLSSTAYLALPRFQREDWKKATGFSHQFDPLLTLVVFPNLAQAAGFDFYNAGKLELQDASSLNLDAGYLDVLLIRYTSEIFDPEDKIPKALEEAGYKRIQEIRFQGIIIWHYKLGNTLA